MPTAEVVFVVDGEFVGVEPLDEGAPLLFVVGTPLIECFGVAPAQDPTAVCLHVSRLLDLALAVE